MKSFLLTYSGYIALFVVFLCLAASEPQQAHAISPFPRGHKDPTAPPDDSKCPDTTLPSVSCQTPVAYGPCMVYQYSNGIREFVCDTTEAHAFPSGLDAYLSVNDAQSVSSMIELGGVDFVCPYTYCTSYLVITRPNE